MSDLYSPDYDYSDEAEGFRDYCDRRISGSHSRAENHHAASQWTAAFMDCLITGMPFSLTRRA